MDDDAKAEAEAVATRRVRLGLLITEIGRENNIEVTEEDTRRAVFEEARRYPGQEQMVLEYFQKNPQAMQQIAGPIFEDKVIDFILEMAKVTDVTIDTDTLYAAPEEGSASQESLRRKSQLPRKLRRKSQPPRKPLRKSQLPRNKP
jgi:trigger factor